MLAKVLSRAVLGIDAYQVEVEVDINSGLPTFTTVGLPEAAVKESKERVKSAISNCRLSVSGRSHYGQFGTGGYQKGRNRL